MSHFDFVESPTLRQNLDNTFDHILTLLSILSEPEKYNTFEISSFYQTIIIYTASIIEALLLDLTMRVCSQNEISTSEWKFEKMSIIHTVDKHHHIVAGHKILKSSKINPNKMNLGNILKILKGKYLNRELFEKIDKVRVLRNEQHFGSRQIISKYNKHDLDFVFSVAKDVKQISRITYKGL